MVSQSLKFSLCVFLHMSISSKFAQWSVGKQFCLSAFLTHPGIMSGTETDFKQYSLLICYFSSQSSAMPHYFLHTVSVLESVRKKKKKVRRRKMLVEHYGQETHYVYFNLLCKELLVSKVFGVD